MSHPAHDPMRLKETGTEAQRTLLRSAPPTMSADLFEDVRRRVERRMAPKPRGMRLTRWAFAAGFTLVAGGALAYGVTQRQALFTRDGHPEHHRVPSAASSGPTIRPVPHQQAEPALETGEPQSKSARKRHKPEAPPAQKLAMVQEPYVEPAPSAEPAPPIVAEPHLSFRDLMMEGAAEEPAVAAEDEPPVGPKQRPGRLLVNWEGHRGVSLDVVDASAGGDGRIDGVARIHGTVNRTPLSLDIRRGVLTGKIGDEVVNLWLKGEESANGSIAGYPVDFAVLPIHNGYLLRGNLPGHTARLEVRKGILRWYPGCENALASTGAGVYQGTCTQGNQASVVLPPNFRKLSPLARLITLALVLTQRDPVFRHADPQLFNLEP